MLYVRFCGSEEAYPVEFSRVGAHIVRLTGDVPADTGGFTVSRSQDKWDGWDYSAYKTIYRQLDGAVEYSDDGSVYVEPVPKVTFRAGPGGSLEGETSQAAADYAGLDVPEPVPGKNYVFGGWMPELPGEGAIPGDQVFRAVFTYVPPLEEIQAAKVAEMNRVQQETIAAGVDVTFTDGSIRHFTLTTNDQLSIMGSAAAGSAATSIKGTPWHIADEDVPCQYFSPEDMARVQKEAYAYIMYHVTYFRSLRIYIRSLHTKEEVEAVVYGIRVPEEYQGEVLADLYAGMGDGNA